MYTICPSCHSPKVVKNGFTHHGKQNHRCKDCGRQFVMNNQHLIQAQVRTLIANCLLERNSLRSICRIFGISLTWLQAFAQSLWSQTPKRLGLKKRMIKKVKKLQLFGLQADEMWSFVQIKAFKRWIWVAFDPVHRVVVAYHIGGRGDKDARDFLAKIPKRLRSCCFETDYWSSYEKIFTNHRVGKEFTYYIEGFFATVRARVSRLVRKSLSFSKSTTWHEKAIGYFFWQYNLTRHPYFCYTAGFSDYQNWLANKNFY